MNPTVVNFTQADPNADLGKPRIAESHGKLVALRSSSKSLFAFGANLRRVTHQVNCSLNIDHLKIISNFPKQEVAGWRFHTGIQTNDLNLGGSEVKCLIPLSCFNVKFQLKLPNPFLLACAGKIKIW